MAALANNSAQDQFKYHVCFTRVLLLIPYGYSFRPPLKRQTIGILTILGVVLTVGHFDFSRNDVSSAKGRPNGTAGVAVSPDLVNWLLSIFISANFIYYFQQWPSYLSFYYVGACFMVGFLSITSSHHRNEVGPQISGILLPCFWTLLVCSLLPMYRSSVDSRNLRSWLIDVLVFVQAGRQAVRERHNTSGHTGIESTTESIAPSVHSSDDFEFIADPERREAFSEWSTDIIYKPLTEDKVRMLQFSPEDSQGSDELRFTLTHYSFSEIEGRYIAVSYYWGKSQEKRSIFINGRKAYVTARLYQTLLEVCQFYDKPIWVDALSINQSDFAERNAQVLRMKSIYGRAEEVVACFGTEDDDAHCSQMMTFLSSVPIDKPKELEFPAQNKASFEDLKAFVKRPYWRRVWIIQELAAARKVSLLACGERVSLDKLSSLLGHVERQPPLQTEWPEFNKDLQLVRQILDIRTRRVNDKPLRLLQVLVNTQRSQSTISHDKVFGILSLTTDGQDFMAEPDYHLSETEICKRMTRSFIEGRQNLDIIFAGSQNSEESGLPSWCPDYLRIDKTPLDESFVKYLAGEEKCFRLGKEGTIWETTGGRNGERRVDAEFRDNQLALRGLRIGRIGGIGATGKQNTSNETDEHRFVLVKQDTSFIKGTKNKGHKARPSDAHKGYSTYDGLCRMLLIYDSHYVEFTKSPIVLGMLYNLAYLAYAAVGGHNADVVWSWLKRNRNLFIHGKTLRDRAFYSWDRVSHNYFGGFFKLEAKTMTVLHYKHITDSVAHVIKQNLRLMSLSEGEVGWVSPDAMLDDEIFLFEGCSLPVVLRRISSDSRMSSFQRLPDPATSTPTLGSGLGMRMGHRASDSLITTTASPVCYRVIGHAIVDGYMDGERWKNTDVQKLMDVVLV